MQQRFIFSFNPIPATVVGWYQSAYSWQDAISWQPTACKEAKTVCWSKCHKEVRDICIQDLLAIPSRFLRFSFLHISFLSIIIIINTNVFYLLVWIEDTGFSNTHRSSSCLCPPGEVYISNYSLCGTLVADLRSTTRVKFNFCQPAPNSRNNHRCLFLARQNSRGLGEFPVWISWWHMGFQAWQENCVLGVAGRSWWPYRTIACVWLMDSGLQRQEHRSVEECVLWTLRISKSPTGWG